MKMSNNDTPIYQLLAAVFDDQQITSFCFDNYPGIYTRLTPGMSRSEKIQRLIDYVERQDAFDELLMQVREINPNQFARFASLIEKPKRHNPLPVSSTLTTNIHDEFQGGDMAYNLEKIRTLLINGFSAAELRRLCQYVEAFRECAPDLADKNSHSEITDAIIDFANRRGEMHTLLDWAKTENPKRYSEHSPYHPEDNAPSSA